VRTPPATWIIGSPIGGCLHRTVQKVRGLGWGRGATLTRTLNVPHRSVAVKLTDPPSIEDGGAFTRLVGSCTRRQTTDAGGVGDGDMLTTACAGCSSASGVVGLKVFRSPITSLVRYRRRTGDTGNTGNGDALTLAHGSTEMPQTGTMKIHTKITAGSRVAWPFP
jgi:hypothetical protein